MRRFGLIPLIYIVIGVLVAAGVVGDEGNFFSGIDNLEEVVELILAIVLWPLVLLGVSVDLGGGGGGGDAGGGGGSGGNGGSGGGN